MLSSAIQHPSRLLLLLVVVVSLEQHSQSADALRMINLDAPESALLGDTILLSCHYKLQSSGQHQQEAHRSSSGDEAPLNEHLSANTKLFKSDPNSASGLSLVNSVVEEQMYAIKWYKDEQEFFRYLAQEWPKKQALYLDGVQVDADKSDNHTVVLKNVSLKTSGLFRCEVSTDAPHFITKSIQRKLNIYLMPNSGPIIEISSINENPFKNPPQAPKQLYLDDHLELTCVTPPSKPVAALDWFAGEKLNLSIFSQQDPQSKVFQIQNQRFVLLPTINGTSLVLSNPHKTLNRLSLLYSTSTYQIYANNTAVPVFTSSSSISPINLSNKIDQIPEISVSKLNITVNQNLIQILENSPQIFIKPTQVYSLISKLSRKVQKSSQTNQLKSSDNKLSFKVKCVSRVLNLVMSNEIKFQIVNKTRDSIDQAPVGATQQLSRFSNQTNESNNADQLKFFTLTSMILNLSIHLFITKMYSTRKLIIF